jgi:hypothetical protein
MVYDFFSHYNKNAFLRPSSNINQDGHKIQSLGKCPMINGGNRFYLEVRLASVKRSEAQLAHYVFLEVRLNPIFIDTNGNTMLLENSRLSKRADRVFKKAPLQP